MACRKAGLANPFYRIAENTEDGHYMGASREIELVIK
jgi:hypothetical protein